MNSSAELRLMDQHREFPFAPFDGGVCTVLGDRLHVVAGDSSTHLIRHLALDPSGRVLKDFGSLPLAFVSGLASCASRLLVTGASLADGAPVAALLDSQGALEAQVAIPLKEPLALWPLPVCIEQYPMLVWVTGKEDTTLWLGELRHGTCHVSARVALGDFTELLAAAGGHQMACSRIYGHPGKLEVLQIVDGRLHHRRELSGDRSISPGLAALSDGYALSWIGASAGELRFVSLARDLTPRGAPKVLLSVRPPAHLRLASLLAGPRGRLAISYQIQTPDRTSETRAVITHFVAACDPELQTLGKPYQIHEPGVMNHCGGWIGGRLLLLHGERVVTVSVFQTQG